MHSDIIGFIAIHILYTVMLSGALAQSKRPGATHRARLLPSEQFPRKTWELLRGTKTGKKDEIDLKRSFRSANANRNKVRRSR